MRLLRWSLQALSDRIALGASLVRGEYNRAWNVILVSDGDTSAVSAIVQYGHHPSPLRPPLGPWKVGRWSGYAWLIVVIRVLPEIEFFVTSHIG